MSESQLLKRLWDDPSRLIGPQPAWPARVRPLPDELLSSWLVRLAMAHGLKLHTFCSMAWPKKAIWNRDIDKSADEELINVLADRTGYQRDEVKATTLSAYEGALYERHNPFGNTLWIMPVGVYHRTRRDYGLQFCARCLEEDRAPYWRRRWRLALTAVCHLHGVTLHDRCPKCGAPVNFHREELGDRWKIVARSLSLCHSCRFDLRGASTLAGREVWISEIRFQQKLLDGIEQGWVEIGAGQRVYSHLYFAVVHQLMRLLATGPRAVPLQDEVSRLCGLKRPAPFPAKGGRDIERMGVAQRRDLLMLADHLLGNWPERFLTFCLQHRVWSSALLKDFDDAPFWYWRVIHDQLYRPSYCPSDEEVRSAISYLSRAGSMPTTKAISKCLGVNNVFRKRKTKDTFTASTGIPGTSQKAFQGT